jgi:hypothetical protein
MRQISVGGNIYELHLTLPNSELKFLRYFDFKQFGRFYCLTLNHSMTRLYTCVNFLNWRNIIFLKQHLRYTPALEEYYLERLCHSEAIPLMFKYYRRGKFTNELVGSKNPELSISEQQGLGFQLD